MEVAVLWVVGGLDVVVLIGVGRAILGGDCWRQWVVVRQGRGRGVYEELGVVVLLVLAAETEGRV